MVHLHDSITLADNSARITRDGYLVADALVGRANNIQEYRAAELGLTDREPRDLVRIFRPEDEVFSTDALASLAHRPITLDHPPRGVDATSWKRLAVGDVGAEVIRDGEFIRVPIKIMDSAAVQSVRKDRREFSLGYSVTLDMTAGVHDGQPYDGVARGFSYNHLAAVRAARGGQELRVIDERPTLPEKIMKIRIGDTEVDLSDGAAVGLAVGTLNSQLADAKAARETAEGQAAALQTQVEAKDGEIAALNAKLADATDPAKVAARAADRQKVIDSARAIKADIVADGKDDAAIRREAVAAKLGDAAKDMSDAAIEGAFVALTKDAKPAARSGTIPAPLPMADAAQVADAAWAKSVDNLNAWRNA